MQVLVMEVMCTIGAFGQLALLSKITSTLLEGSIVNLGLNLCLSGAPSYNLLMKLREITMRMVLPRINVIAANLEPSKIIKASMLIRV